VSQIWALGEGGVGCWAACVACRAWRIRSSGEARVPERVEPGYIGAACVDWGALSLLRLPVSVREAARASAHQAKRACGKCHRWRFMSDSASIQRARAPQPLVHAAAWTEHGARTGSPVQACAHAVANPRRRGRDVV
jgi:hypothetical protein